MSDCEGGRCNSWVGVSIKHCLTLRFLDPVAGPHMAAGGKGSSRKTSAAQRLMREQCRKSRGHCSKLSLRLRKMCRYSLSLSPSFSFNLLALNRQEKARTSNIWSPKICCTLPKLVFTHLSKLYVAQCARCKGRITTFQHILVCAVTLQ